MIPPTMLIKARRQMSGSIKVNSLQTINQSGMGPSANYFTRRRYTQKTMVSN